MALVAYDSEISDSDEDLNEKTDAKEVKIFDTKNIDPIEEPHQGGGLFEILPQPINEKKSRSFVEEEVDEFLLKKEVATEELPPKPIKPLKISERKTTKIVLTSLSSFEDKEESKPRFKQSAKGAGLLSLLPQPRSAPIVRKENNTKFVPHVLNKSTLPPKKNNPLVPNKGLNTKKGNPLFVNYASSEDSDSDTEKGDSADFFSLNADNSIADTNINSVHHIDVNLKSASENFGHIDNEMYKMETNNEANTSERLCLPEPNPDQHSESNYETNDNIPVEIDHEELRKLGANRDMRRGEVQFIDIDQKAMLPDAREWMTKALTEDNSMRMSSSKRRGDEPTTQQRRKHQITYLAHQAKANEQELQNQWANNRLTKKQTQSKYGF